MYRRHIGEICSCWIFISALSFFNDWDFDEMAGTAITFASIAVGVYIAAVSALLGSQYSKILKQQPDHKIKDKTFLGVLAQYFRYAGFSCMLLIVISCIYCIPANKITPLVYRFCSAFTYGLFAVNFLFMWLILIFLVNSLGKSVQ